MRALSELAVAVRQAVPSDDRFIVALAQQAFGEFDPHAARTTASMMRQPQTQTLVAVRADQPLGFVVLRRQSPQTLAIDAIAVAPRERGKRVGQLLMRSAEQYARSQAVTRITLCTAQANLAALELFLRAGFVITSRNERYWGRQPACTLEKRVV